MKTKKIYINPGHSDKDPGAVGYETERELNVVVSAFMNDHLLSNYVCETRMNPGTMGDLAEIAEDANKWGADLLVSNHFNAGGGDGWEGLVYSNATIPLGRVFEKHVKAAGQNSRGVKQRPDLAILRRTHMEAILNEGAFVDNKKDIQDWNDDAELKKLGIAYAEAAAEYLKLEKKPTASTAPVNEKDTFTVELKTLRPGDVGEQVVWLQRYLIGYGGEAAELINASGGADGKYFAATKKAVEVFQSENVDKNGKPLTEDGIAGPDTFGAMFEF